MNTLEEIPKDQLDHFKTNVKDWLEMDEKIKALEKEVREMKKVRNKQLEPKITGFMRSYNISDLNTDSGKLRCNELVNVVRIAPELKANYTLVLLHKVTCVAHAIKLRGRNWLTFHGLPVSGLITIISNE